MSNPTSNERSPAHWLGELLAIIHGDGGHYQAKHGDAKATQDAIAKFYATRFDALCRHGIPCDQRCEICEEWGKDPVQRLRSLQGESPSTGTTSELVAQRPEGSASESPALRISKREHECECRSFSYYDIDDVDELVSRLHQQIRPSQVETGCSGWQPIATAPTNCKVLLWWRTCREPRTGYYQTDEHGEGWRGDGDQCLPRNQKDCTHWMPLPSPPNASAPLCPTCKTELAFEGDTCGLCGVAR